MKFLGDRQTFPALTKLSRYLAFLILALCPIELSSWIFDLPILTTLGVNESRMSVPTILVGSLCAICILLVPADPTMPEHPQLKWLRQGLLAVISAVSFYFLASYLVPGIPITNGFADPLGRYFSHDIGGVAIGTATNFLLFAIAMFIGRTYVTGHISALLTTTGLGLTGLALISYAYDLNSLLKVQFFAAMSLPTALLFALLFTASLLARPTLGWTTRIIGPDSGGVAARRLLPGTIAIPFLIGWIAVIGTQYPSLDPAFGFAFVAAVTTVLLGIITYQVSIWLARRDVDLTNEVVMRRQAQEKLQDQNYRLNLLNMITHAIAERQDDASIFQIVIHALEERLPLDFASVCLCDPTKSYLTVQHVGAKSFLLAQNMDIREHARIEIDGNGLSTCVKGQLVYEPDTRRVGFPFPQRLVTADLKSLVLSPLMIDGSIFGMLIVARVATEAFSSGDCEFISQLSEHVAVASHQSQLRRNLQLAYDEMRDTQHAVMQHERLRALGQMASGITHDINNAIAPISIRTQSILETEKNLSEPVMSYLTMVNRQVNDVSATIERLREFYREREDVNDLTPVDLNALSRQVIDITEARWKDMARRDGITITVESDLDEELPLVMGKDNELREVMVNLIFNAVDAMPEGGTITIRSRTTNESDSPFAADLNELVTLEITDTGTGMSEATIRRCMEPFFTTKGDRGTGLGLAMVHGILKRHDANISIKSKLGHGTNFCLTFPKSKEQVSPDLQDAAQRKITPMRLLLIDDDPYVLESLILVLELDGHKITGTTNAKEGLKIFKAALAAGDPFETVVTDLGMPELDGNQVSRAIKSASASTPVILLTGWGQRLGGGRDKEVEADFVLAKPPQLAKMRDVLRHCQRKARDARAQ